MRWLALVALAVALVQPAAAVADLAGPATPSTEHEEAAIEAVYPNPVAHGDRGEFVVVSFPPETDLSGWSLADDDGRAPLGDRTVSGRVAFTDFPDRVQNLTDARVVAIDLPALANRGERVRLVRGNATVDALGYRNAPEAERYLGNGEWRALGATARPVVHTGPTRARAFVLPDAPEVPVAVLRDASDRLLLAGYTFTSRRATRALVSAHERGVDVRVLIDGGPVGGLSRREARTLDRLVDAGIEVRALGGPYARYDFHHAKYAVADDRALVVTENWKPSGTGGRSSRGWGTVVADRKAADALAATFRADAGWRDARPWTTVRETAPLVRKGAANGTFARTFAPETVLVENASVLVAPENAEEAVVDRIDGAQKSVRIVQPTVGGPGQPFVGATIRAARRGVDVKLLLSDAWYVREENERLVERLDELAAREGLPLEARIVDPRGRFEKVHAKGLLVDGETAVVGSMNWNNNSARANREVLVALESEAAADYYGRVFRADWRGAAWRLPLGLGAVVALGAAVAVAAGRKMPFSSGPRRPGR